MSQPLVVSKTMPFSQVALVIPLFLPSVMAFLMTIVRLYPWVSWPVFPTAEIFVCHIVSEDMVTIMSSLASEVTPLYSVSLVLAVVKAKLLPPAMILVVVSVVRLAMHCGASQQLFHLIG